MFRSQNTTAIRRNDHPEVLTSDRIAPGLPHTPVPRKTRFRLLAKLYRAAHIGLLGSLRKVSTDYFMRLPPFPGFAWRKDDIFGMDRLRAGLVRRSFFHALNQIDQRVDPLAVR
jgi:hypothetical protein